VRPDPVAAAIAEAGHAEAETRYRLQLAREMYQAGHEDGYAAGWRDADADMEARWAETARRVVQITRGPTHAELEERRWGPGGRAHFADPRPGDFPGRGAQPQQQPQPQAGREIEATA
jgi:hypothetical protein